MTLSPLATPSISDLQALLIKQKQALSGRKLELYRPYLKQKFFHNYGRTHRERLFRAGNQLGKSVGGSAEAAIHATGRYPDWWDGRRFTEATNGWCSGVTGEVTRDTIQRLLLGPPGEHGTGFIPRDSILDITPARGQADLVDTIMVRHVKNGRSRIKLKYYEQGREKFQADTLHWAWNDEEPDEEIYTEILTRTNATGGLVWTTFTPLKGMSNVVRRFLMETSPDRIDINMTIDDAEHISPAQRQIIINSYPAHEREARLKGTPMLGSGRIFPVPEEQIKCDRFEIPSWFKVLGGIDFGWDHPTAAIKLAYNPDEDVIYVTHAHRQKEATPIIHANQIKPWGKSLRFAWPHDGLQHDKGSGVQLAEQYRDAGLLMLEDKATFEDGTNGVEAGVTEMLERMETGRWKVFSHLSEWFEEFRLYHRKDGKIIKEYDDLLCASRYAMMMLRYAKGVVEKAYVAKKPQGTSGLV